MSIYSANLVDCGVFAQAGAESINSTAVFPSLKRRRDCELGWVCLPICPPVYLSTESLTKL